MNYLLTIVLIILCIIEANAVRNRHKLIKKAYDDSDEIVEEARRHLNETKLAMKNLRARHDINAQIKFLNYN